MTHKITVRRIELKPRNRDTRYPLSHVRMLEVRAARASNATASRGSYFAKRDDE